MAEGSNVVKGHTLEYVAECDNLLDCMINIINNARVHVYHVAIGLDLDANGGKMLDAYERALARGVRVYLCMANSLYRNNASRLRNANAPNLTLVTDIHNATGARTLFATQTIRGQHIRFICNEHDMLMNGGNTNRKPYSGNCGQKNCRMYETGMLIRDYTKFTPAEFVHALFGAVTTGTLHTCDVLRAVRPLHIMYSGHVVHDWIVERIRTARHEIYMENQYFVSYEKEQLATVRGKVEMQRVGTNNTIAKELANRITLAIKNREAFHATLICNEHSVNNFSVKNAGLNAFFLASVSYMRSLVKCTDATFRKYFTLLVPRRCFNTYIHAKVWCFDRSTVMITSGNIMDRSFSDTQGDYELAWILGTDQYKQEDLERVCEQIKRSTPVSQLREITEYHTPPVLDSVLCECTRLAIENYLPLRAWHKLAGVRQVIHDGK